MATSLALDQDLLEVSLLVDTSALGQAVIRNVSTCEVP